MKRASVLPVAILVVALAVIVYLAAGATPGGSADADPSSVANGRAGTLALYTWLDRLGYPTHRIEGSFDLSGTDVLISVDPGDWSSGDVDSLAAHLQSGGDAIVATGEPSTVTQLIQRFQVSAGDQVAVESVTPSQPYDSSGAVRSVPLGPGTQSRDPFRPAAFSWTAPAQAGLVPLLGSGDAPVAAVLHVQGGGRLYLVGSVFPFSNDGLRDGDSAPFVLSLLERARGGHIGFDEFHHEAGQSTTLGLAEVFRGPLLLAVLLGVLVIVFWLATSGRRLGRPVPARSAARVPTAAEHIDSIAQLFARSQQRGAVAQRFADELKQRIGSVTGTDPHLDDATFCATVSGYGAGRTEAARQLLAEARALGAGRPTEGQLVALARRVDSVEREWTGGLTA